MQYLHIPGSKINLKSGYIVKVFACFFQSGVYCQLFDIRYGLVTTHAENQEKKINRSSCSMRIRANFSGLPSLKLT